MVCSFFAYKKILGRIETRTRDKSTSGGCDQFETSPEAIDQELRPAVCERRQTDRLKTNYRVAVSQHEAIRESARESTEKHREHK